MRACSPGSRSLGILVLFTLALTWLAVIAGLAAKSTDGAGGFAYPLLFLPFLSSAFVPTDGMPGPVRWFAEHQPVTSIVDTLRNLYAQQPLGNDVLGRARLVRGPAGRSPTRSRCAPTGAGRLSSRLRRMLTISQLAAYAGVTVRAVRHYHAKGLLPEPERDHSGYRRYDAAAVVELIRIRTLADAGVPLSRVRELLAADEEAFAAAVEEIDQRLRAEIRERQRHRERIALLAAGDSLALPPEAVAYLDRLRGVGVPERDGGGRARRLDPRGRPAARADAVLHGDEEPAARRPARPRALPRPRAGHAMVRRGSPTGRRRRSAGRRVRVPARGRVGRRSAAR